MQVLEVIRASDNEEFGRAVRAMLDYWEDPVTRVVVEESTFEKEGRGQYPKIKFIKDSVLLFSINDYRDLENYTYCTKQFNRLGKLIPTSKGLIFDLRSSKPLEDLKGGLSSYLKEIENDLVSENTFIQGLKTRYYDGFPPEAARGARGYTSGYYIKNNRNIVPAGSSLSRPVVFLVNKNSELPLIALAMQKTRQAKILFMEALTDEGIVETLDFNLGKDLKVILRQNMLPDDAEYKYQYNIQCSGGKSPKLKLWKSPAN